MFGLKPIKRSLTYYVFGILLLSAACSFVNGCNKTKVKKQKELSGKSEEFRNDFIGSQKCKSCHVQQYNAWIKSDHFHAMAPAGDSSVEGSFNNTVFTGKGAEYRFFKKDKNYMVRISGPDGRYHNYKISYTFGWNPLQQYLVHFPGGKLQALTVAWDVVGKKWFSLYPRQNISGNDWLNWTHGAMNWNTMCADCHSTNLKQNYYAPRDSFYTTWSEINVACEACHGPGRRHVAYIDSLQGRKPDMKILRSGLLMNPGINPHKLVDECARCHSLREQLRNSYNYNESFMDSYNPQLPVPERYYGDGQIRSEDYVYGSFLQSKMYHQGISCINCHDPHTMHIKRKGNKLCTGCHNANFYDTPEHYHHKLKSGASLCVNCHMPGRYYMQVDFRRDHSFRIPRPDLTMKYGTPNACNNCHKDKSAKWANDIIKSWKGKPKDRFFEYSEVLAKADREGSKAVPELIALVEDTAEPVIARAAAIWYLGQFPDNQALKIIKDELKSPISLIRVSAVNALSQLPVSMRKRILEPLILDSVRAVRVAAAEVLADLKESDFSAEEKPAFKKAEEELQKYFQITRYFPSGQFTQAEYYEKKQNWNKAIEAYKKALTKDFRFNKARIYLAYLYDRLGRDDKAEPLLKTVIKQQPDFGPAYYSMALLISRKGSFKQALPYFEKAIKKMPDNARVFYNEAIVFQKLKRYKDSERAYLHAIKTDPDNVDYRYGICTLFIQQKLYRKALPHARKLVNLNPGNQQYEKLLEFINSKLQ